MWKWLLFVASVANIVLIAHTTEIDSAGCKDDVNAVKGCGNCPITCENYNNTEPPVCTQICYEDACDCKPGYVLDVDTNKCILPSQCVSCGGDPNAEPGCSFNCGRHCSNYNQTVICPRIECPPNGCQCKNNYVYDDNIGKCVRPSECTPTCGTDEYFSSCSNGGCFTARTCEDLDNFNGNTVCARPIKCIGGCLCKDGLVRNDNGICIPESECPNSKCKGANETYIASSYGRCVPETCKDVGQPLPCESTPNQPDDPRCVCVNGYVRDNSGKCIPTDQCLKCTGPHEYYSCGGACDNVCATLSTQNQTSCPIINIKCNEMCYCEDGYARDDQNNCVPFASCPPTPTCGPDEYLDSCANGGCYSARTCKDLDTLNGNAICVDTSNCTPGCLCKEGLVRNDEGVCVPENKCPNSKCKGDDETYSSSGGRCVPETCDQLGYPLPCENPNNTIATEPGCVCRDGYVRDCTGKCIPKDQCPSCGGDPNAKPGCGVNCGRLCSNYDKGPIFCPEICNLNGCDCKEKYVFDSTLNKCVLPEQCPPTCGPDEYLDSCANGGCYSARTCKDLDTLNGNTICVDTSNCTPGCLCKEGLVRNDEGVCVPENKCPNSKCKGDDETYSSSGGRCVPETCDQLGYPLPCENPNNTIAAEPGCVCRDGYVRGCTGKCIPKDQCPSCGGDPNAKPGCGVNCGRLCSNYDKGPVACPAICKLNGCDCKEKYVFDSTLNKCVLPEQCPPTCGPDEYLDSCANGGCYSARTCKDLDTLNGNAICVDTSNCTPGCLCKEGLVRNDEGVCVPENKCPNSKCKGDDETYSSSGGRCVPETCDQLGHPLPCENPNNTIAAEPGCVCRDGYVRGCTGKCIPKDQCPSCGGDPNAKPGCGVNCGRLCSNYDKGPVACPAICKLNGCDCKEKYVFDSTLNKCVLPEQCPPTCGPDEYLDSCANGGCYSARTCKDLDTLNGNTICVDTSNCTPGCLCKEGLVRNDEGVCVPENKCPNSKCKGDDETYSSSGGRCVPETCDQLGYPLPCENPNNTIAAEPGCVCRDGYVRDYTGKCIPKDQCPSCGGDPNAKPGCGVNCGRLCSNYDKRPVVCPRICKLNGCDCKEKYVFDSTLNKCVLPERCYQCGKNEVYDTCVTTCPPRKCGIDDAAVLCAPIDPADCKPGCRCADGYVRNDQGECVNPKQCSCT